MDKYYTPELNEFCLEFEYEERVNGVYEKKVFDGYTALIKKSFCGDYGDWYDSIEEDIESDRIRVKYLSKEDIESLGWEQISYDSFKFSGKEYNYQLDLDHDYKTYIFETNFRMENFFKGIIKNKSELIKLLKQLGIE